MKRMLLLAIAAASFAGTAIAANSLEKGDPSQGKVIVEKVCAACHGADGNSGASTYPSLAGQNQKYLVEQLKAFKSGTRKNPIMLGMASTLSDADMWNVTSYLNQQKPKVREAADKAQIALGKQIYRGGNAGTKVPACMACHGPSGAGLPDQFPRLGGQHAAYVVKQLGDFKAGTDRKNGPMGDIAARLSDAETKAVAEYISGLR